MTESRTPAQRAGKAGEDYAAGWLAREGYKILARNWRCRLGEVDIIAKKGDVAAFVEVKARRPGSMVSPLESVGPAKRKRLLRAAKLWLLEHPGDLQPRMDVAAVTLENCRGRELVSSFEYYESAFENE